MKELQIVFFLLIFSVSSIAQVTFEKGYIINKDDKKIECFIKNLDRARNPDEIKFKLMEDGVIQNGDPSSIKEFRISSHEIFRAAEVDIDVSSNALGQLSREKNPLWERKKVFLKLLVDGKASLYFFNQESDRFFYSLNSNEIKQLIYKEYLLEDNQIAINKGFKQQLFAELDCGGLSSSIESVNYLKNDLIKYFKRYNVCADPNYVEVKTSNTTRRGGFNLYIGGGVSSTSLNIKYQGVQNYGADFGKKVGYNAGIDLEYMLPFRNRKWSVLTTANYQEFTGQDETEYKASTISLKFVNLDLWLRHYFYLSPTSSIHIGSSINLANFLIDNKYGFLSRTSTAPEYSYFEVKRMTYGPYFTPFGASIGVGLNLKKIGLELRYSDYNNVLRSPRTNWYTYMEGVIFMAKYGIVKTKSEKVE